MAKRRLQDMSETDQYKTFKRLVDFYEDRIVKPVVSENSPDTGAINTDTYRLATINSQGMVLDLDRIDDFTSKYTSDYFDEYFKDNPKESTNMISIIGSNPYRNPLLRTYLNVMADTGDFPGFRRILLSGSKKNIDLYTHAPVSEDLENKLSSSKDAVYDNHAA